MKDIVKIALGIVVGAILLFFGSAIVNGIGISMEDRSICGERHPRPSLGFDDCMRVRKSLR